MGEAIGSTVGPAGGVVVVVPFQGRWYFDEVVQGAMTRFAAARIRATVIVAGPAAQVGDRGGVWTSLLDGPHAGIVLVGIEPAAAERTQIHASATPVIVVGGTCPGSPSVMIDDEAAARQATQHLIDSGHTEIVHLGGTVVRQLGFAVHGARIRGYTAAMGAAGLDELCRIVPSEFGWEPARRRAMELLTGPARPSAVFAVSDEIALALLDAAAELRIRVPDDLSVIGIDDHPTARHHDLSTVAQHPRALGTHAADLLIQGHTDPAVHLHPTELVLRGSTASRAAPRSRLGKQLRHLHQAVTRPARRGLV